MIYILYVIYNVYNVDIYIFFIDIWLMFIDVHFLHSVFTELHLVWLQTKTNAVRTWVLLQIVCSWSLDSEWEREQESVFNTTWNEICFPQGKQLWMLHDI